MDNGKPSLIRWNKNVYSHGQEQYKILLENLQKSKCENGCITGIYVHLKACGEKDSPLALFHGLKFGFMHPLVAHHAQELKVNQAEIAEDSLGDAESEGHGTIQITFQALIPTLSVESAAEQVTSMYEAVCFYLWGLVMDGPKYSNSPGFIVAETINFSDEYDGSHSAQRVLCSQNVSWTGLRRR